VEQRIEENGIEMPLRFLMNIDSRRHNVQCGEDAVKILQYFKYEKLEHREVMAEITIISNSFSKMVRRPKEEKGEEL
jgi:hypothetical protein